MAGDVFSASRSIYCESNLLAEDGGWFVGGIVIQAKSPSKDSRVVVVGKEKNVQRIARNRTNSVDNCET